MFRSLLPVSRSARPYYGSALLSSCWRRAARVSVPVGFLWVLAAWAMGWW